MASRACQRRRPPPCQRASTSLSETSPNSTVRAWVERGDFAGAYKLHGKEWRVPASAVEAFQNGQRRRTAKSKARLSAWRMVGHVKATAQSEPSQQPVTIRPPRRNAEA